MGDSTARTDHAPRLHCLEGQEAPPSIAEDAAALLRLPASAKARIWDVLPHCLSEPLPQDLEARLDRFVAQHGADEDELARAIKACRFLLRRASLLDVSAQELGDDLRAIAGGSAGLAELLLPGYERVKALVRSEAALRTVTDHGKLLERFHWRLDTLTSSDRGHALKLPVLTLTLHIREGTKTEPVTVQVLPDVVAELAALCHRVLGKR